MSGRLGIRARLLVSAVAVIAVALALLVTAFNLILRHQLEQSATDRAQSRARAELAAVDTSHGAVAAPEAADAAAVDVPIWIYSGSTVVESPRSARSLDMAVAALVGSGGQKTDVGANRLYAEPISVDGRPIGTVVSAVSMQPYRDTARSALILSIVVAVAFLGIVAAAIWWILGRAFRPVSAMAAAAEIWGEHDLDRRFGPLDTNDELAALGATLNGLLERIATSLRRERLLTAEISHELRTPLARIRAEADLAIRRERSDSEYRQALSSVADNADRITEIIETMLEAARVEAGQTRGSSDALATAVEVAAACRPAAEARAMRVEVAGGAARIAVEQRIATRILQPIVENACRHGQHLTRIEVVPDGSTVRYAVSDDGEGVDAQSLERIFEPGVGGGDQGPSIGLGLALARRMARSVGGDVTAESRPGGHFTVVLPAAR